MTDFYSQNRCVCSMRSHGPLLYAFCLCFHFKFEPCILSHFCTSVYVFGVRVANFCKLFMSINILL